MAGILELSSGSVFAEVGEETINMWPIHRFDVLKRVHVLTNRVLYKYSSCLTK